MLEGAAPAGAADGRAVTAALGFAHGGGRTFLRHQRVPYPFHITRPHALHAGLPRMATLILQSASGGLYRGDRLEIEVTAAARACAHVTSQAATVVHAGGPAGIAVETRLRAGPGAVLMLTTDPYVLFPGAALSVETGVDLGPDANVVLAEGFATHDPSGAGRPFGRLDTRCRVRTHDGACLVDEGGGLDGPSFLGAGSPLGSYRAMGTVMLLGSAPGDLDTSRLIGDLDRTGVLAGATALPNGAGLCIRMLAAEGGRLARGLNRATAALLAAVTGCAPVRQRR